MSPPTRINFKDQTIELDGKRIKLRVRDSEKQDRFVSLDNYYRGVMGIMLVYDITNERSFENLKRRIREIEEHASTDVQIMILGNKYDLLDRRQVLREKGEQLAREWGIKFMETSAKASINVEEAFLALVRDIKSKREKRLREAAYPSRGGRLLNQGY